ncbi:MAG: radical SAM protein [Paludibacteraceae bacterium]|nr:radical SAM protein [Paludibacteraceae bacterium]
MRILLTIPPLTQLNTAYPSTSVLKGYLEKMGHTVFQSDLGIELICRIYTKDFLQRVFDETSGKKMSQKVARIFQERDRYIHSVEAAIRFLQGKDRTLAPRIANRSLFPEGPRFDNTADMEWAFGVSGIEDKARYIATLFIEDIADYLREMVSPFFDLIKYAESLSSYAPTFDKIEKALNTKPNIIDIETMKLLDEKIKESEAQLVGFSVPFPGCLYAALRCGQYLKKHYPGIKVVIGGGFPNTELRHLSDSRIFQYADYITLDDGELPIQRLTEYMAGKCQAKDLIRTYYIEEGKLIYSGNDDENIPFSENGTPNFSGLKMDLYLSMTDMVNPMHKLWSCGKWNKMVMAHGCYWAKCAFCDTTIDYICRYDAPKATLIVDRMESIIAQTGETGFHFTDEALPPKLLKEVAEEILRRKLTVSFWGNVRFEKSYTQELCDLLSDAGCVAVSGGLEVASDRLLKLMNKGVSIGQAAESARHFTNAGIMVHTYLMYGFPGETLQETINAIEVVRQLFCEGLVQSAFWHRYAMTEHSPSGQNPEKFNVRRTTLQRNPFANNEIDFEEELDYDIDAIGEGLNLATYNYMHGIGLETPVYRWFSVKVPKPDKNETKIWKGKSKNM